MQHETDEVRDEIYQRLINLKGVGPCTALACANSVVQYLHALVEGTNNPETDDDGVTWMKRPSFVPSGWEYLTWSSTRPMKIFWVFDKKPRPPENGADHWCAESDGYVREKAFYDEEECDKFWDSLPDLPPEQRLFRLFD